MSLFQSTELMALGRSAFLRRSLTSARWFCTHSLKSFWSCDVAEWPSPFWARVGSGRIRLSMPVGRGHSKKEFLTINYSYRLSGGSPNLGKLGLVSAYRLPRLPSLPDLPRLQSANPPNPVAPTASRPGHAAPGRRERGWSAFEKYEETIEISSNKQDDERKKLWGLKQYVCVYIYIYLFTWINKR